MTYPMQSPREVLCEACGSEGRIYSGHANNPHPRDEGECPVCEGHGVVIIETEPVELDDLEPLVPAPIDLASERQRRSPPVPDGECPKCGLERDEPCGLDSCPVSRNGSGPSMRDG